MERRFDEPAVRRDDPVPAAGEFPDLADAPVRDDSRLTGQAEVDIPGGRDGERRGLLVVERAQALQIAAARRLERHGLADHIGDRRTVADQRDVLVLDPYHRYILPPAKTEPPRGYGATPRRRDR